MEKNDDRIHDSGGTWNATRKVNTKGTQMELNTGRMGRSDQK